MPATWNGATRGLDDLNGTAAALEKLGAPAGALEDALRQAAGLVVREAQQLAPVRSGALRDSIIPVIPFSPEGHIEVQVMSTSPYAWNFHATEGRGQRFFVFDVRPYTRRGRSVSGYSTPRRLPNNPFMFAAFDAKADQATDLAVAAIDGLCAEWVTDG